MEDALAVETVKFLLEKILFFATERISLLFGLKEDIATLKESVAMIQAVLADAEKKQEQQRGLKEWLKKIEGVAFDADNVLDRLNYELLRRKAETSQNLLKNTVNSFSSSCKTISLRWKMAPKVRDINMRLKSINQEANSFGLHSQVVIIPETSVGRETDSIANQNVIGRANDTAMIVKELLSPSTEVVSFFPITGMGGIGKTTLAQLVYNDTQIDNYFHKKIWVCVSANFEVTRVFNLILESLWSRHVDIVSRDAMVQEIKKELQGKRYLLVLDDVWCESCAIWGDFLHSLEGISTVKGNWTLVTTRLERAVASIVTASPPFALEKLSDVDCWSILEGKALSRREVPEELIAIREEIIGACQGLPLVASLIGGLLRMSPKEKWLSIVRNEIKNMSGETDCVMRILRLSFDHLPCPSIKKCFAYCSLFRNGSDIEKERLIQLWMAEGFLQYNCGIEKEMEMEAIGCRYFDILVKSSLFQEVTNEEDIICGRMHGRVHDLAQRLRDDNSQFRYLLLKSLQAETHAAVLKKKSRLLRTVFAECCISDGMLLRFKFLRVLDLSRAKNYKELPNSISKLKCLRYLDLSDSDIKALPESLCKLYYLQTVRILRCYRLRKLPRGMSNLISLRHLHYDFWEEFEMPLKMGKLTCLQTLGGFAVGREKGSRIDEVGKLMNLRGRLVMRNLELVKGKEDAKTAKLLEKTKLVDLTFEWRRNRKAGDDDENVLEGLKPPSNLQKLEVCNFMGSGFPAWLSIELTKLVQLRLSDCKSCEEIPALGQLPLLMTLVLHGLDRVRCIGRSFYGINNSCRGSKKLFPALRSLELLRLPNLTNWMGVETLLAANEALDVYPKLEKLTIRDCNRLTSTPTRFPRLKELQLAKVGGYTDLQLLSICNMVTTLTTLEIHSADGLTCIPDEVFFNNQSLVSLTLGNCSNLMHVKVKGRSPSVKRVSVFQCKNLKELHIYKSYRELEIWECPNLKLVVIPSDQGWLSLQSVRISYCDKLSSLPGEVLRSSTYLKSLMVSSCCNLVSFPVDLQQNPSLSSLELYNCPKLITQPKGFGTCSNLRTLAIGPFSHSVELDWVALSSSPVQQLSLHGWPHSVSLPVQIQCLTAIALLSLEGFGSIESLPHWLGKLRSLKELRLVDCEKLRSLPSKEAMGRLNCLQIQHCPLLTKRCTPSRRPDSEWSKISHIPKITIDYTVIPSGPC